MVRRIFVTSLLAMAIVVAAIMTTTGSPARDTVIRVPDDFSTIQEAIDATVAGDIVVVADGVYIGDQNKNLDFNGKDITVRSENSAESTVIDCEGNGRGFYLHSGESLAAIVEGFTIRNASQSGIYVDGSHVGKAVATRDRERIPIDRDMADSLQVAPGFLARQGGRRRRIVYV